MFISRPKKAKSPELMEFAANGKDIPLAENWLENWCSLYPIFDAVLENVLQFEVRSEDVFLVTFMKSGSTWMQEMAWMLLNDLDYEQSGSTHLSQRSPFLEAQGIRPYFGNEIERCNAMPSPRLIKSHLQANLLPQQIWKKKAKIIYVARNCKDVIVSSYHFQKDTGLIDDTTLENFVTDFLNNDILYGGYWQHVLNFWKMRNEPNVFFVTYEEMKRDLSGVIERLSEFLEKPKLRDEQMQKLLDHLSFNKMKENPLVNTTGILKLKLPGVNENFEFMRRGIVGSFKDELTPELQAKIDEWSRQILAQHGLTETEIYSQMIN